MGSLKDFLKGFPKDPLKDFPNGSLQGFLKDHLKDFLKDPIKDPLRICLHGAMVCCDLTYGHRPDSPLPSMNH